MSRPCTLRTSVPLIEIVVSAVVNAWTLVAVQACKVA